MQVLKLGFGAELIMCVQASKQAKRKYNNIIVEVQTPIITDKTQIK